MIEKFGGDFLVELFIRRDNTICELENIHEAFFSNFEILFLSIIDIIHLSFQLASFYSYSFSLVMAQIIQICFREKLKLEKVRLK